MAKQDTIQLLQQCDVGAKMGEASIGDVLSYVNSSVLRKRLEDCRDEHIQLRREIQTCLTQYHEAGKDPGIMAKSMSRLKTNVKLAMNTSDETVADLMTDGCNMGVKSLNKYLNRCKTANEVSRDIAKRLAHSEEQLGADIRCFL